MFNGPEYNKAWETASKANAKRKMRDDSCKQHDNAKYKKDIAKASNSYIRYIAIVRACISKNKNSVPMPVSDLDLEALEEELGSADEWMTSQKDVGKFLRSTNSDGEDQINIIDKKFQSIGNAMNPFMQNMNKNMPPGMFREQHRLLLSSYCRLRIASRDAEMS